MKEILKIKLGEKDMKKIIFTIVMVVGIALTAGNGSKLVAGDNAMVIDTVSQLLETYCRVSRVTPGRDDSNAEKNKNQCNTLSIDWDVILNLFAEYFACIKDNGGDKNAIAYCKCLAKHDYTDDPSIRTYCRSRRLLNTEIK